MLNFKVYCKHCHDKESQENRDKHWDIYKSRYEGILKSDATNFWFYSCKRCKRCWGVSKAKAIDFNDWQFDRIEEE